MTEAQRDKLKYLMAHHPHFLMGNMEDLVKLHETWCLRIGVDDKWLDEYYERHKKYDTEAA